MEDLRRSMRTFRELDDAVRGLNKQATTLREQRKVAEVELGNILKTPEFQAYNVLKVEDDGSTIRIQRPNTWYKPWSLSKRDLQNYIEHYFENAGPTANREDCFTFIIEQQKQESIAEEIKIVRTVPNDVSVE